MIFAGIMIDSLKIDRLEKRWAARFLFLLVFAISVCSDLWPLGDPDLSRIYKFAEEYSSVSAAVAAISSSDAIVLPVITNGNMIYFLFVLGIMFVLILISILYARLYVGEKSGQKPGQSVFAYIRRLPVLIIFFALIMIPSMFLFSLFPVLLLFVIPALFFSPILITLEKANPINAIIQSYRLTNGIKLPISWDIILLFLLYQISGGLYLIFLPANSSAGVFLNGFCTAFFILAFGRMVGIFYDRVRIHPVVKTPGPIH